MYISQFAFIFPYFFFFSSANKLAICINSATCRAIIRKFWSMGEQVGFSGECKTMAQKTG